MDSAPIRDSLPVDENRATWTKTWANFFAQMIAQISSARPMVSMFRTQDSTPSVSAKWVVFGGRGEPIDIAATTTEGLQEAINEAAAKGYDLKIYGGGIASSSGQDVAVINCSAGITVPPLQGAHWEIHATINIAGSGTAIEFDSLMASEIIFRGRIVCDPLHTVGVRFNPVSELPQDTSGPVITSSRVSLPSIVVTHASGQCVQFDGTGGPIIDNVFDIMEPNGGAFGLMITPAANGFISNKVRVVGAHGQTSAVMSVGTGATTVIYGNQWELQCYPETGCKGADVWGRNDIYTVSIANDQGTPTIGVKLEVGANKNVIIYAKNDATTPLQDLGAGNQSFNS